jgi:hypothetical protein
MLIAGKFSDAIFSFQSTEGTWKIFNEAALLAYYSVVYS